MATLEKIRSKSVLLVVIIAVALLAFILGDAITNGRNLFGNSTTVAKVGKNKIEIQDYQRKQQELSRQMEEARKQNPQQFADYDPQLLSQGALEELIQEALLDEAVAGLGYKATPEALRFFMIENPQAMLPEMQTLLRNMNEMGFPVQTPADAYTLIFQPQTFGLAPQQVEPLQRQWVALEARYSQAIGQYVYQSLLMSTFKANDLDVAAMKRDYVASANVKVAKKPYGNLDEKKYPINDSEIKKAYDDRKEEFKVLEPTKEISFIALNVTPSGTDVQKAGILAETVVKELKGKGLSKETRKNGLDVQRHEMRLKDVRNPLVKAFVETAAADTVSILDNGLRGFTVAKMGSRTSDVDSIQISLISVIGNKELLTKVVEYANSGAALDSLSKVMNTDSVQYQAPEWVSLYTADGKVGNNLGFTESVYDSLFNSNGKYIVVNEMQGQTILATVNQKSAPKEVVSYETVEYELHPSDNTLNEARQKLEKFIATNNTAEKFVKNAHASGFAPVEIPLTASMPAVPRGNGGFYPESRPVVRWVLMDGKVGEVSKIYQSKDAASPTLYVAAVLDSYDEYVPATNKNVKEDLTAQVRREKAGAEMIKQYKKGSVEESAKAMQVEPVEIASLQSSKPDATVIDSKAKGRMLGSKPGKSVQAVQGNDAVYIFVVNSNTNEEVGMDDETFGRMFLQLHNVNPTSVLRGNKKIENNIYKFEAAE